jgi:hypothetical protein
MFGKRKGQESAVLPQQKPAGDQSDNEDWDEKKLGLTEIIVSQDEIPAETE